VNEEETRTRTADPSVSRPLPPKPSKRGRKPKAQGAAAFRVSPFARLARTHGAGMAGDAMVAIALADSLFFSIDPNDARWRVALYLLLTVAPFGVIAPWLGPAMDRLRGGHRYMLIASATGRSVLAIAMAVYIDSLFLFPLAFSMLVMGKTHHIAKSALVPAMVRDESALVHANSRLSIISSVAAGVAGIPGVILLVLGGAPWTLGLASVTFVGAAVLAFRVPAVKVAESPAGAEEKAEMRGSGIVLAASAMGYVRAVVGFLTLLLAFELRGGVDPGPSGVGVQIGHRVREALGLVRLDLTSGGAPTWHFGVVLLAIGVGGLAGAFSSPRLRKAFPEERILAGVLAGVGLFGLLGALAGGLIGGVLVAFAVSVAGQAGKQSFDAIVQRDAKESNLGRSFARFESRFQLLWVFGALIPVVLPIPARLGYLVLAGTASFAAVSYWLGRDPSPKTAGVKRVVRQAADRARPLARDLKEKTQGQRDTKSTGVGSEADEQADAQRASVTPPQRPGMTELPELANLPGPTESVEPTEVYVLPPGPPPTEPPPPTR
jgi:hypothetical protein